MKVGLIYRAVNIVNGKCYIGQTCTDFEFRVRSHKYCCNRGIETKFYNAMRKYGFDKFKWEIIENNIPEEFLSMKECEWIQGFNSFKKGYNSTIGGEKPPLQIGPLTEQRKQNISKALIGKSFSEERKQKMKGIAKSEEHKKKLSEANKNKFSGKNNPFYGKQHSEDSLEKISKTTFKKGNTPWNKGKKTK